MPQVNQTSGRHRGRPAEPLEQRITRLTDQSGECWLWKGYLDRDGYGRITINQRPDIAHRVSYETFVGPIPDGAEIDHLCRVRHCVRPEHLEPVSRRENVLRQLQATGSIGGRRISSITTDGVCVAGHAMDEQNTYRSGRRLYCRECHRKRNREYAAKRRAQQRFGEAS